MIASDARYRPVHPAARHTPRIHPLLSLLSVLAAHHAATPPAFNPGGSHRADQYADEGRTTPTWAAPPNPGQGTGPYIGTQPAAFDAQSAIQNMLSQLGGHTAPGSGVQSQLQSPLAALIASLGGQ